MREAGSKATPSHPHQPSGKPKLDRRTILEAGADFIDRHGVRELSMRRLGASLGVEAMSLYRHVPSRENLLDGVVELMMDRLYGDPEVYLEPRNGWQDYLFRPAHGLRRMALAHPGSSPWWPPGRHRHRGCARRCGACAGSTPSSAH